MLFEWANLYGRGRLVGVLPADLCGAELQGSDDNAGAAGHTEKRPAGAKVGRATPAAQPQRPDLLVITDRCGWSWCACPRASFLMGSDPARERKQRRRKAAERLRLPEFYIGKYPVTNESMRCTWSKRKGKLRLTLEGGRYQRGSRRSGGEMPSWHEARDILS